MHQTFASSPILVQQVTWKHDNVILIRTVLTVLLEVHILYVVKYVSLTQRGVGVSCMMAFLSQDFSCVFWSAQKHKATGTVSNTPMYTVNRRSWFDM